jgi:hypothetical protein
MILLDLTYYPSSSCLLHLWNISGHRIKFGTGHIRILCFDCFLGNVILLFTHGGHEAPNEMVQNTQSWLIWHYNFNICLQILMETSLDRQQLSQDSIQVFPDMKTSYTFYITVMSQSLLIISFTIIRVIAICQSVNTGHTVNLCLW